MIAIDAERGTLTPSAGAGERPTCLAADPLVRGRAWCGTHRGGVYRSDDGGASWRAVGLEGQRVTSIAASPAQADLVWVGTEPSEIWYSANGGEVWNSSYPLETLPSSPEWSFPPKPDTHHVRWIACHPRDSGRLWVAIEAGALVSTRDGGRSGTTACAAAHGIRTSWRSIPTHRPRFASPPATAISRATMAATRGGHRARSRRQIPSQRGDRSRSQRRRHRLRVNRSSLGIRDWRVRRTIVSPREGRGLATSDDRLARSPVHDRAAGRRRRFGRRAVGWRRARRTSVRRWRSELADGGTVRENSK